MLVLVFVTHMSPLYFLLRLAVLSGKLVNITTLMEAIQYAHICYNMLQAIYCPFGDH